MAESKLEEILKGEKPAGAKPPIGQPEPLKSALEKELEADDAALAKDLQRTRAEEIIATRQVRINQLRTHQLNQDGGGARAQDPSVSRGPERGKEWLTDIAQGLLDKGMDPSIVGRTIDYLLGTAQFPQVGLPGAPAPAQGMTFTDMKELFKMGQEANRTDPAIAAILEKLTGKITALESNAAHAVPPKTNYILVKADGSIQEIEAGKPIILEPKPVLDQGKALEVVKEDNRHSERMAEVQNDRWFKEQMADTLGSIPEQLGEGLAGQIAGRSLGVGDSSRRVALEELECPGCHTKIPIYDETTSEVECPHCHVKYKKKAEAATQ